MLVMYILTAIGHVRALTIFKVSFVDNGRSYGESLFGIFDLFFVEKITLGTVTLRLLEHLVQGAHCVRSE